jgi:hypothetical protein
MSQIVIEMEMPRCCAKCRFVAHSQFNIVCQAKKQYEQSMTEEQKEHLLEKRLDDCPLKELLPHGRLIDENDLHIKDIDGLLETGRVWDAPTILDADGKMPPHGRLIDADALQEYYEALDADNGEYVESASETAETIANAPTILEASR